MKTIKLNLMEISCSDGGGYLSEIVALIDCGVVEAEDIAEDLSRSKKWPHRARLKEICISYFEDADEYRRSTTERFKKEQLKKQLEADLAKLQKEIDDLA